MLAILIGQSIIITIIIIVLVVTYVKTRKKNIKNLRKEYIENNVFTRELPYSSSLNDTVESAYKLLLSSIREIYVSQGAEKTNYHLCCTNITIVSLYKQHHISEEELRRRFKNENKIDIIGLNFTVTRCFYPTEDVLCIKFHYFAK